MADVKDPVVGFKYGLEVSGKLSGYFTSVSGIGSETEVITQKIVSEKGEPIIKQIPGRLTWNPITLRRGVTDLKDVWDWRQMVVDGKIDDTAFSRDSLTVQNIEFGLLKRRSNLILNYLNSYVVTDNFRTVLQCLCLSDIKSYGRIELQCTSACSSLGITEHDTDLLTKLVDEDTYRTGLGDDTGELS